jgi:hypothetical protein
LIALYFACVIFTQLLGENLLNAIEIFSLFLSAIENYVFSSLPSVCNFGSLNAIAVTSPENSVTHGADGNGMLGQDVADAILHAGRACSRTPVAVLPAGHPRAAGLLRAAASNLDCVPAGRRAAAPRVKKTAQ